MRRQRARTNADATLEANTQWRPHALLGEAGRAPQARAPLMTALPSAPRSTVTQLWLVHPMTRFSSVRASAGSARSLAAYASSSR